MKTILMTAMPDRRKIFDYHPKGYVLICDDDILYPDNYVETMIAHVDRLRCPVSVHGCMAYHTDIISFTVDDFPVPLERDLQIAIMCKKRGLSMYRVPSEAGWLIRKDVRHSKKIRDIWRRYPKHKQFRQQLFEELAC